MLAPLRRSASPISIPGMSRCRSLKERAIRCRGLRDYGWIAVDFFFAISGFVICLVVTSPRFEPLSFMIRRAFRIYPLWIATSLAFFLSLLCFGRVDGYGTPSFFLYSLTLLPTNGFPFYDLGWSLQHEMLFYVLAAVMTPWTGLYGVALVLITGLVADRVFELPWYLHQYFFYYGNFLAGIAAFLAYRGGARVGFLLPLIAGMVAFRWAPGRAFFPIALFFWLVAFVNLHAATRAGRLGVLLGDTSYSIYLLHPLVFHAFEQVLRRGPLPPLWVQEPLRYVALMLVCCLALASWRFFERPMIQLGNRVDRYMRSRRSAVFVASAD
ncbi:MAG: acyltransferase [Xanthobacteraceae bacterium]|nr:acyltransferase [Xanthobacteraceae bacterium]